MTNGRSSSCSRTSWVRPCRRSPSTTRRSALPLRQPSSARSTPSRLRRSSRAATSRAWPRGVPCWVEGVVTDVDGHAVPHARIEIWEADDQGYYDVQYGDGRVAGRACLTADSSGAYRFWALKPTPYPIPADGPVGVMLHAAGRSPLRAAHLHFMVTAPGYRRLVTHIFVEGDRQLILGDSVFGVRDSLIKRFEDQEGGTPGPDGRDLGGRPWTSYALRHRARAGGVKHLSRDGPALLLTRLAGHGTASADGLLARVPR